MKPVPKTLSEFKRMSLSDLRDNSRTDSVRNPHLKVQLVETNTVDIPPIKGCSEWRALGETSRWYVCDGPEGFFVLNKASDRIWALYSMIKVDPFVRTVDSWISRNLMLDKCWISQGIMQRTMEELNWSERGIGLRFEDCIARGSSKTKLSIKAWYGDDVWVGDLFAKARENFSVNSLRMRSLSDDETTSEWYTDGRITFNSSEDVDTMLYAVAYMCDRYHKELEEATRLRDTERGSFEFSFCRDVDLERYEAGVSKGLSDLKLWMVKTEDDRDFKRFKGVDTHSWDTVFLDLGSNYAYMAVPGKGCVNAAPRLAAVQGETATGRTRVYYNGSEIFVRGEAHSPVAPCHLPVQEVQRQRGGFPQSWRGALQDRAEHRRIDRFQTGHCRLEDRGRRSRWRPPPGHGAHPE